MNEKLFEESMKMASHIRKTKKHHKITISLSECTSNILKDCPFKPEERDCIFEAMLIIALTNLELTGS